MRASKRVFAVPAVLVTLGMLAGCAGEIPTPTSPVAAVRGGKLSISAAGAANRHPNSVKYRDAGAKPATGRSGSASLEVRALLGMDGGVTLEATTGSLEAGTHPGNISKTQVKILAGAGATNNYNNLNGGGYWTTTFQGLTHGDGIQVQANVRGIDPRRTDVVTVLAHVARRPDLTVSSLTGPAEAPASTPVTFVATIAELNGDVGARTNCVISVDGTDVDHADGIWVDAGDNVSCMFTHAFPTTGTHNVSVSLTGVTPGDWNLANNAASTSISIHDVGTPISYGQAYAYDFRGYHWYYRNYSLGGQYRYDYSQTYDYNYSYVYTYGQDQIEVGDLQRIDFAVDVDGVSLVSRSLTTPTWSYSYDDGTYWQRCWQFSDGSDYGDSCSYGSRDPNNTYAYTYYQVQHVVGSVTYVSNQYYCDQYNTSCNTYFDNQTYTYGTGVPFDLGNSVRIRAAFVEVGGTSHTIDKTITDLYEITLPAGINYSSCYFDSFRGADACYEQGYPVDSRYRYGYVYW